MALIVIGQSVPFWPIPNSAITANTGARLRQNYGYDGYDEAIPMFTNWEEAVADEELSELWIYSALSEG